MLRARRLAQSFVPAPPAVNHIVLDRLAGLVKLNWSDSLVQGAFQIEESPNPDGPWFSELPLTMAHSKTFPAGENAFWRVKGQQLVPFTATTNQPRLNWNNPDLEMSDSITSPIKIYTRTTPEPAGQLASDYAGWAFNQDITNQALLSANDTVQVPANGTLYYKMKMVTANGVVVPHQEPFLTSQAAGSVAWAKRFGGINSGTDARGNAITTDSARNIYIAGQFFGTIDVGNGIPPITSTAQDAFVLKLDPSGTPLWISKFNGATGNDQASAIAVDNATGNVFIGGITVQASTDMLIAMFNSSGVFQWKTTFDSSGTTDEVTAIGVDSLGNPVITGDFVGGQIDFGGGVQFNVPGGHCGFLLKLSKTDGSWIWSKVFTNNGDNFPTSMAIDSAGDIVVGGRFTGPFDPQNTTGNLPFPYPAGTLIPNGSTDGFLVKFHNDGSWAWQKQYGGGQNDSIINVAINRSDSQNIIFVSGLFQVSLPTDVGTLNGDGSGNSNIWIAKLNSVGVFLWARACTSGSGLACTGLAVDTAGNVTAGGNFSRAVDFGAGSISATVQGQNQTFTAKYRGSVSGINPSNYMSSVVISNTYNESQSGTITTDSLSNVFSTGRFNGTAKIPNQPDLIDLGFLDVFLLKLNP